MKKVWILDTSDYDVGSIIGIFEDEAMAQAAAKAYNKKKTGHGWDAHVAEATVFDDIETFMAECFGS